MLGRTSTSRTHLWTDSDWVANSLNKILPEESWEPSDHEDLWQRITQGLEAKGLHNFEVTKVSARTSASDCTTPLERERWRRNDAADGLAK